MLAGRGRVAVGEGERRRECLGACGGGYGGGTEGKLWRGEGVRRRVR